MKILDALRRTHWRDRASVPDALVMGYLERDRHMIARGELHYADLTESLKELHRSDSRHCDVCVHDGSR